MGTRLVLEKVAIKLVLDCCKFDLCPVAEDWRVPQFRGRQQRTASCCSSCPCRHWREGREGKEGEGGEGRVTEGEGGEGRGREGEGGEG